jgi:hypothetical protein
MYLVQNIYSYRNGDCENHRNDYMSNLLALHLNPSRRLRQLPEYILLRRLLCVQEFLHTIM